MERQYSSKRLAIALIKYDEAVTIRQNDFSVDMGSSILDRNTDEAQYGTSSYRC